MAKALVPKNPAVARVATPGGRGRKPAIFAYHDYRSFLRDWIEYRKAMEPGFSVRRLGVRSGISKSNLSMILQGTRKLSRKSLPKLALALELDPTETFYLEFIVDLTDAESADERIRAIERMNGLGAYRAAHPKEAEAYQYLSSWHFVAIREMSALRDFRADPAWIHERLAFQVGIREVEAALQFLLRTGLIERAPDGTIRPPSRSLDCKPEVYGPALSQYHRQLLALAGRSIDEIGRDSRSILGYTLAVDAEKAARIKAAVDRAYQEVRAIANEASTGETVVHIQLAMFPMTRTPGAREGREDGKK